MANFVCVPELQRATPPCQGVPHAPCLLQQGLRLRIPHCLVTRQTLRQCVYLAAQASSRNLLSTMHALVGGVAWLACSQCLLSVARCSPFTTHQRQCLRSPAACPPNCDTCTADGVCMRCAPRYLPQPVNGICQGQLLASTPLL